jgi:hypothetical protein
MCIVYSIYCICVFVDAFDLLSNGASAQKGYLVPKITVKDDVLVI